MKDILTNIGSSITGNISKAILFIRKVEKGVKTDVKEGAEKASALQKKLLESTSNALKGGVRSQTSFSSLTGEKSILGSDSGYLALEVQFNPATLYLDTVAGVEVEYEGGNLGARSANQLVQMTHPASTTLSFELIFDDMNIQDSFMLENIAPSVGNIIGTAASTIKKATKKSYTVQPQMDGIMSLLTRDITRQVIFFWGKTCFPGELVSVNSRYTMFNKEGNPVRGVVHLSIRQGEGSDYTINQEYWDKALDKAFGKAGIHNLAGKKSTFAKGTNNTILNLNL